MLQSVVVKAINKMLSDQQNYLNILQENIATVIKTSNAASEEAIDQRLMELQKEIISKANNKEAYDTIADEIFRLRELKHQSEIEGVTRDEHIKRISELHDFITQNPQTELTEFDEALVRRLLKKVTVYDEVEKEIKKDSASRLHARRQMLKVLYPVTEVPTAAAGKKKNTKTVDLTNKLFDEIAPKYADRNGGYTRIVKIGQRKGDGALEVLLELV